MDTGIEIAMLVLLAIWTIEDLICKKICVWELVVGTAVIGVFLVLSKADIRTLLPGLIMSFMFLLVSWLSKGNFGLGDSWVIGIIGLSVCFQDFILTLGAAFITTMLVSVIMILLKKSNRKTKIPFIPFLLVGFLAASRSCSRFSSVR